MKSRNYKLPGLPGLPITPASTTKVAASNAGIAKSNGFSQAAPQSITFGKASRTATKSPKSSSAFSRLLSSSTSNSGLGGTISQAAGFSGGIGLLISGISSLFGGGTTAPPALPAYQLPTSQSQIITTGGNVAAGAVYGSGPALAANFENQEGHIVQSVKQALLNSSSLNDVIAEL